MTCLLLFEVNGYILVASFCSSASRVTLTITNTLTLIKLLLEQNIELQLKNVVERHVSRRCCIRRI